MWANNMKLALQVKNKLGFVTGICERPTDDEVLKSQWDRCNSIVLTWILNSVCEELYVGQVYSQLASEVWTELRETYEKIDGSLDAMIQLPSCSCQASKGFSDFNTRIKLMQFLMVLDDFYQPVRTNLLTREPLPSIKTAFPIVSREESHRNSSASSKAQSSNVGFVSKTNHCLVTGSQIDGLYLCGGSSNLAEVCFTSYDQFNLWHSRLGHPASQVLSVLKDDLNVKITNDSLLCDVCHKANQHREPFPLSDHVSLQVRELVHLDVWEPYRLKSREGFRYFLTVVDDFSKAVWVYLLKIKLSDNDNQGVFNKSPNDEGGSVSYDRSVDQPPSNNLGVESRAGDHQPSNAKGSTSEIYKEF
ncbi:uncharacterized protein LOC143536796 [Bidens hawaiensis]|uniref:uncharacterized protein LOC143536796 n=1 Tax=Bidens hawaiensis TaxID=980011 RepID=UPI00404A7F35